MATASNKVKITVTGVPETALYTLWIKAQESLMPDSKLRDKWAIEAVNSIDNYDFSGFSAVSTTARLVSLRSRTFDSWTTSFLNNHSDATVVNLACGLESRALRMLPLYPNVRWVDVDLPDMVVLRRQLLPVPKGDYRLIAGSVTEEEWLSAIPTDKPTLIVAEGLLMYLSEAEVHSLIRRLVNYFSLGGQLLFDTVGTFALSLQPLLDFLKHTNSSFTFGMDDFCSFEKLDPRLKLCEVMRHADYEGFSELPANLKITFWLGWYIPWVRNLQAVTRYEFSPGN